MLEQAVEESRKQKRRGTPNVSVFAGMSLPDPLVMPIDMPKRHVRFLHAAQAEARHTAGLPPATDADTRAKAKALLTAADGGAGGCASVNGVKAEVAAEGKDEATAVKEEGAVLFRRAVAGFWGHPAYRWSDALSLCRRLTAVRVLRWPASQAGVDHSCADCAALGRGP